MAMLLKIDNDFTPCPVSDGDEIFPNGIFEFNITKMIEYIEENLDSIILKRVKVNAYPRDLSHLDESKIVSTDISQPVILAEISPDRYNLIDGHHRLEKARQGGIKNILAYRLKAEQHLQFLISKKAYLAYVEYWNGKLNEMVGIKKRRSNIPK